MKIRNCVFAFCALTGVFCTFRCIRLQEDETEEVRLEETIRQVIGSEENRKPERDSWEELSAINPDLIAYLKFDSGLISLPVVQAENNTEYLSVSFDGSAGEFGTLFLDMQNETEDEVLLIYGHCVIGEEKLMLSPLLRLQDQETLDENDRFSLYLDDRILHCRIFSVFVWDARRTDLFTTRIRNFRNEEEKLEWLQNVRERSSASGSVPQQMRQIVILQCCTEGRAYERLAVAAYAESASPWE